MNPDLAKDSAPNPFAPGMPDGPPLPTRLPARHGEPVLDPFGQREPIVYVPDAYGDLVPMPKSALAGARPTPPPPPAPRGMDPLAQRFLAATPFAAATGWGVGQAFNAYAGIGTGSLLCAAAVVAAWKVGPFLRRHTTNHITTNINPAIEASSGSRWFGKADTHIHIQAQYGGEK